MIKGASTFPNIFKGKGLRQTNDNARMAKSGILWLPGKAIGQVREDSHTIDEESQWGGKERCGDGRRGLNNTT